MNSGGFLLHDNMRGLLISQRPAEILAFKNSQVSPFMSRVNNSSPLGLPPIRNTMILPINNQVNYVDRKNKEIIRKLETLKKYEKNAVTDEEKNNKIKYEKAKIISNKQNTAINQMRKELYGDLVTSSPKHENKNTKKFGFTSIGFYDKKNSEANLLPCLETNVNMGESIPNGQNNPNVQAEPKINKQENESQNRKLNFNLPLTDDLDKLEKDENEHEINNLLNFVNNLDYEKYSKDLEIREALYLIKNKVEKDRMNEEESKLPENQDNINYEENKNYESVTIPPIPQQNQNGYNFPQAAIMHDKDWDNSTKPIDNIDKCEEEENIKKEIANKILKSNKNLRAIHSINSVKRLLEREGVYANNKLNDLRISVIKTRQNIQNFEYKPSMLCNLRDLPII